MKNLVMHNIWECLTFRINKICSCTIRLIIITLEFRINWTRTNLDMHWIWRFLSIRTKQNLHPLNMTMHNIWEFYRITNVYNLVMNNICKQNIYASAPQFLKFLNSLDLQNLAMHRINSHLNKLPMNNIWERLEWKNLPLHCTVSVRNLKKNAFWRLSRTKHTLKWNFTSNEATNYPSILSIQNHCRFNWVGF